MRNYSKLKQKLSGSVEEIDNQVGNLNAVAAESRRVADLAGNARAVLGDLDRQLGAAARLEGADIAFLLLATALQCARQYLLSNEKFRFDKAADGDRMMRQVVPKSWRDVLLQPVPYDAVRHAVPTAQLPGGEKTGISGNTHRYRTLGHDPVLGWIFGPVNILTDSLTMHDLATSYRVENGVIQNQKPTVFTPLLFRESVEAAKADRLLLPAAVARQAVHFGSDYFTKQGLPLPLISTVDNRLAGTLMNSHIDLYSVTRGAALAALINALVACIHRVVCRREGESEQLLEVRTRKILRYSNVIASSSNILYVAFTRDLTKLDLGGILVTLHRLISDAGFIATVKREFLEREFYNLVLGDDYEF